MSEVIIAAPKPAAVTLEAGKEYWWCACGRSKTQPFCDGSHEGTGIEPKSFTVETTRKYAVCQCKHTQNGPFCDGAHAKL
ncbi:MAG: cytochrome C551 [Hyphomicrobiales bacterium]|nr:MAG: cytochrome C551 [Hyphomicrobiales bacterium]